MTDELEIKEEIEIESIQEILDRTSPELKEFWLSIFLELQQSERYRDMMEKNFNISYSTDEETKTINIMIVETPIDLDDIPMVVNPDKIMKMNMILKGLGVPEEDAPMGTNALLQVLRGGRVKQKPAELVKAADMDDIAAELKAIKDSVDLKKELD